MKKLLSILLVAAFLLGGAGQVKVQAAGEENTDIMLDAGSWLISSAYVDGRMYLISSGGLFAYTPGEEKPVEMKVNDLRAREENEESEGAGVLDGYYSLRLFEEGGQLYAVDLQNKGMIYPISVEADTAEISDGVKIDVELLRNMEWGDEGYIEDPMQILGSGGRMYLVNRSWTNSGSTVMSLLSYDIARGGEAALHNAEFIWRLSPYKDGKMLALVMDPDAVWDEKTSMMRNMLLAVYDPQADTQEELGDSGVPFEFDGTGLGYDIQTDRIYIQGKSEVYVSDGAGTAKIAAYLMPSQYGGTLSDGLFVLPGGRVMVVSGQTVSIRAADPDQLPEGRLTIYGSYMDDTHQKTMKALGDIPVTFLESKWFNSAQELGQALISGEDNIDVFVISGDYIDVNNLMSKGYAADLSSSSVLQDHVASLYPMMKDAGVVNGKLYMVPVDMNAEGLMSYYTKLIEQVEGLELPHTYAELIGLLQKWNDELGEEYPDFVPMQSDDYKGMMIRKAITMQQDAMAIKGEEFIYNDPQLKEMLSSALALNTEDISPKIDWEADNAQDQIDEMYSKVPLLQEYYWIDLQNMNYTLTENEDGATMSWGETGKTYSVGQLKPLLLSIQEGDQPITQVQLTLMAVNPKSKNLDAAVAYVEQYVKSIEPYKLAMMNPSLNDDIPNPNYERDMKDLEESIQYFEEAIKKADGAEKTELEAVLERQKTYVENRREEAKYIVRKETIDAYRELIANSYIRTYEHNMAFNNEEMNSLLNRLIEGQTPLEQFVNEADGKLRLMRLEGQ